MEQIILFGFLALFPFGQIIKIGIINPIDFFVGIGAFWAIYRKYKKPEIFKYFINFFFVIIFGYLVSTFVFRTTDLAYGLLYLIRVVAYSYFLIFVSHFKNKKILLNSLLLVSVLSAVFGWIQYFLYPDIRALFIYGWDDHLFRMVGTFLDPAFLALILVFGLVISLHKKNNLISIFLLTSIAFTYSRASFLASLIPLFYKKTWLLLLFFVSMIFFLPRTAGEGVKLERTSSIDTRLSNYKESFEIFRKNPLLGVGFNNICLVKDRDFSSHSCFGSESSLLFLLATTGILGLISFTHLILHIPPNPLFTTTAIALFIHSFFANSLFYPWIIGWMVILLAITLKGKVKS